MVTAMIRRSMAVMRGIEFQIMLPPSAHDQHGPPLSCYTGSRDRKYSSPRSGLPVSASFAEAEGRVRTTTIRTGQTSVLVIILASRYPHRDMYVFAVPAAAC